MRCRTDWKIARVALLFATVVTVVCSATSVYAQRIPTSTLERTGGILRWDEAMPLGNGLLGALVWGDGNIVRISLDRGDLWDLRTPDTLEQPNWTWATIQRLREAGDFKQINQLFDVPYDITPYPTKLPGGRIELGFDSAARVSRFVLDLASAQVVVTLNGSGPTPCVARPILAAGIGRESGCTAEVRVRLDAVLGVGFMSIRGAQPTIRLVRPAGLDRLGYGEAITSEAGAEWTLKQDAAQTLSYAVVVKRRMSASAPQSARYAFIIDARRDGRDPIASGRARVTAALGTPETSAWSRHLGWWARFWKTSSVRIPDDRLQRHYDLVKYYYGAASRPDAPPISLQGVWTADEGNLPPWKGDYHHDLNTQMTYLAYHAAGLVDQGLSFLNQLRGLLPRFREFGWSFYRVKEAIVPGVMAADGQPLGGWAQYSLSPTNSAWVAKSFYLHWKYTGDTRFLRERAFTGPNGFHLNGDQTRSGLSGFTYRPFTLEGNFLAMQAVHEMLLQSWGGVVRVFPATSEAWQDASFDRLRAEGGWIVSAERKAGRTVRIEIRATAGGVLRLRNPFGDTPAKWNRRNSR